MVAATLPPKQRAARQGVTTLSWLSMGSTKTVPIGAWIVSSEFMPEAAVSVADVGELHRAASPEVGIQQQLELELELELDAPVDLEALRVADSELFGTVQRFVRGADDGTWKGLEFDRRPYFENEGDFKDSTTGNFGRLMEWYAEGRGGV
jgi:hypothetical protein